MFNHIVLMDRSGEYIWEIVKKYPQIKIILIAEKKPSVLRFIKNKIENIHTFIDYEDFLAIQNVEYIDYQLIEKLKFAQNDIETMLHRILFNNPLAKDIYHQHLSFFAQIFSKQKIDLVLCVGFNLSTPSHLIPFALGKMLGIPVYALEYLPSCPAISINNYNKFERLAFQTPFDKLTPDMLTFYKHCSQQKIKKTLKEKLQQVFGSMLFDFLKCCIKLNFNQTYLGIEYSIFDKILSLYKLKKLRRIYQKISIPPNYEEKYIYYSIHFEPEATVIGKTILESQLTMIKMLAKALPNGWKLYVKEHPHQFMLNTSLTNYLLHNITFFKNSLFYREIKKIKNVELITLNASTKDLIQNSQAIATINGTVTLEAMLANKYAILFSGKAGLFGILDNVFHITSFKDVQLALDTIVSSKKSFSSKIEFEKLKKHIANIEDSDFYHNLFTTIETHTKTIQPTGEKL